MFIVMPESKNCFYVSPYLENRFQGLMPESKNRFYVSPYLENRFQGDAQLFVRTRTFVKNANIKFSHFLVYDHLVSSLHRTLYL